MNNNKSNNSPEEYAKKLNEFNGFSINKRHLLNNTLQRIDREKDTPRSVVPETKNNPMLNQLRAYIIPVATFMLVVIFSGVFFFRNSNPNINSNITNKLSQSAPNGTIENTFNSVSADLADENSINEQAMNQGENVVKEMSNDIKQLGDISNDPSL